MKKLFAAFLCLLPYAATPGLDTLHVPSDKNAQYRVIQVSRSGDFAILQSIRTGRYGHMSVSSRLFDCVNATFKYLVTVDGEENAAAFVEKNSAAMENLDTSDMGILVPGSISYYAYLYSCQ